MPKLNTPKTMPTNGTSHVGKIAAELRDKATPVGSLKIDPDNARLHPTRNMDSLKESLNTYGQCKPIVVRRSNRTVIAGNGTLEAARQLGWTHVAAVFVDMDDLQAAGYGLADNRTAELAKWNYEVVAKLEKLITEAGQPVIGWSNDELEVVRAADFTPPEVSDDWDPVDASNSAIKLTAEQQEVATKAFEMLRTVREDDELTDAECVVVICAEWLETQDA